MSVKSPYQDTAVPVTRSKAAIEKALTEAGARAVRFGHDGWTSLTEGGTRECVTEFVWPVGEGLAKVRLVTRELAPIRSARGGSWSVSPEQRERQAWRALAWYIETMLKAAQFGLMRFEEVFLAFIVDPSTDQTLGERLIPQIESGAAALLEAAR